MGNIISSTAKLSSLSIASITIGFISFLFTLATALRVFWGNLRTISSANAEVSVLLPSLKQSILEERAHLRMIRRRCRGQYDEGAFHVLYLGVRQMLDDIRALEAPFRVDSEGYGNMRGVKNGKRRGGRSEKEKRLEDGEAGDLEDDYYMVDYEARTLGQRWAWLHTRSRAITIADRLNRTQTRRIARQTTDIAVDTRYIARAVSEMQDRMEDMEQRTARRRQMD